MRLKPALTSDEAYQLLCASASLAWGAHACSELSTNLRNIADAMAVVSALEIPGDVEPLFGEDPAAADAVLA